MKNLLLLLLLSSQVALAQNKKASDLVSKHKAIDYSIPLTADKWEYRPNAVEFLVYKGQQAVRLNQNSGEMFLKESSFANGTIEFDFEVNQAMPFATIYFRQKDKDAEHVYVRTGAANKPGAFDAIQYASIIDGVNTWDLQHEFQSAAAIKIKDWNHVKLVVNGKQLRAYINDMKEPALEIPAMEGNSGQGRIGLGSGFPGETIFANLVVKPNETEDLPAIAAPDITKHDTRYIRNWQVSKLDSLPLGRELITAMIPKQDAAWENIIAERRGLVNLSRKYGSHNFKRCYVWLRAGIKSDLLQTVNLKMGFSDEIWVYINKQPVYVDKENYLQNMRKSPNGRISLDNCQFPITLKQGENELLIGVANDFYGWGIMARLEHLEGIEIMK